MQHTTLFLAYLAIAVTVATIVAPPAKTAEAAPPSQAEPVAEVSEPPSTPEPAAAIATPAPDKSQEDLNKEYLTVYGLAAFGANEVPALLELVRLESGFRNTAKNPRSSAYGLFQFLDRTWTSYGYEKTSDPLTQIEVGIKYIKARYGTPSKALTFWHAHHWY